MTSASHGRSDRAGLQGFPVGRRGGLQKVSRSSQDTPWKPIAIALAIVLVVVLIFAAFVVAGVMDLGWSLM